MCAHLVGCGMSSQNSADEQKDPHYLSGRNRVTSLDYKGAVEEFEKAIEGNPRSASAHLELGLLYEEHMQDFAAAIYHYQKHLQLRPNSDYTERAKDRIRACKAELVKTEYVAPVTQGMQRDLEKLMTENVLLKQRIETLEAQLANKPLPPVQQQSQTTRPTQTQSQTVSTAGLTTDNGARTSTPQPQPTNTRTPEPTVHNGRTHTVKSGDKLTTIARRYNIELSKLMQANPGVDATRLQIGQTLNIP